MARSLRKLFKFDPAQPHIDIHSVASGCFIQIIRKLEVHVFGFRRFLHDELVFLWKLLIIVKLFINNKDENVLKMKIALRTIWRPPNMPLIFYKSKAKLRKRDLFQSHHVFD